MGLGTYQRKRKFRTTPEPKGKPKASKAKAKAKTLRFVVQKHAATRLHYDFRLELDGVLLSWAIPKGPSLNPADKRLAMKVEDHPYEYRTFEGIIPEGNYGAGTVMVWDEGTYTSYESKDPAEGRKKLKAGLANGDLKFILHGKKLRGAFALVKMKGRGENNWLLIKKQDKSATDYDITAEDRSAKTGWTMEQIAEAKTKTWRSDRSETKQAGQGSDSMPHEIKPMLATLLAEPFDRPEWLFEIKWDGYRAIAEIEDDNVQLYSRNLQPFNAKFPTIVQALERLGHSAVLDGEVVVLDQSGKSHFQLLQDYIKTGRGELRYYVFDLLYLDGHDTCHLPLRDRKELLAKLLPKKGPVLLSEHVQEKGIEFFQAAIKQNLEGIMAKDCVSTYRTGRRSSDWLKIKTKRRQEAVVAGFTEPRGSRQQFGAVVLGVYEGGKLAYIGHTGGGFNDASLAEVYRKLQPLRRKSSPFKTPPKTNAPVTWVTPKLVCEVAFQEWTGDGRMRQPIFMGLREDKPAAEVRRERPAGETQPDSDDNPSSPKADDMEVRAGQHRVTVTHLSKVYWPKEDYTKRDLLAYYQEHAKLILPYLKDRPENLNRHPHGINGQSFYQKNFEHQPPAFAKTKKIYSESNQADINYLMCQNEATLLYMANLGCIELNPWHSRIQKIDKPDYLLIDLDAKTCGFATVVKVAQTVRKVLEELGVASYPKTSGKSGLHICLPLGAKYSYDQAKQFAELLMHLVHQQLPGVTSLERNPEKRRRKVYLDFLQNRRGQTMAAAYCLRPVGGATVSTPLEWREVRQGLDPKKFTIKTIDKRLDKKGDLWKPVIGKGVNLAKALKQLEQSSVA